MAKPEDAVLLLNQKLLQAVGSGDYETYASLCDPSLTCFEPEALGHLVGGLAFHEFYFDAPAAPGVAGRVLNSMSNPHVRMMSTTAAVVSYVRLTQKVVNCIPETHAVQETRVWEEKDGKWVHVHVHRSPCK
ncbi:MAG: hypothetical protein WDW38_004703 [Sanguina aurantia]